MFTLGGLQKAEPILEKGRIFGSESELEQVPSHIRLTSLAPVWLENQPQCGDHRQKGCSLMVLDASPAKAWGPRILMIHL